MQQILNSMQQISLLSFCARFDPLNMIIDKCGNGS